MGLREGIESFFGIDPKPLRTRSYEYSPDVPAQLLAVQHARQGVPFRPSIREALSVPAVYRAVSILQNVSGALPIEGYRNGRKMAEAPKLLRRPNPFSTRRAFVRNTVHSLATRGEALWWISSRVGGFAESVIPLNPAEVKVEWAKGLDGIEWAFTWRDRPMAREDIVHLTLMREPSSPRGMGPLQVCGAAVSVAIEATEWAANFFAAGGVPSVHLKSPGDGTAEDAATLKADWVDAGASNTPRVSFGGLEAEPFGVDPDKATYVDVRNSSVGEIARMFGIPGHLEAYGVAGASLTYQALPEVAAELIRFTLWPEYLEPIEQALTDLLPRGQVAKFEVDSLLRPDAKTRWEIYGLMKNVIGAEAAAAMAAEREGLEPGSIDTAPTPLPEPSAFPTPAEVPSA